MNRDGRSSSQDPTSEPAVDQSTQSASGLSSGRSEGEVERNRENQPPEDEAVDRSHVHTTPRRYEQPLEDDQDPVMPSDDSTLNTKI